MLSPGLLTHLVRGALAAARAETHEAADDAVRRIVASGDFADLFAVCRALAAIAVDALRALHADSAGRSPDEWVVEDRYVAGGDVARLFTARVVTASANHDIETVFALVAALARTADQAEQHASLRELLTIAVGLEARAAQNNGRNNPR